MDERTTIAAATDPAFIEELSEYLEVLGNPVRLKILKFIEGGPKDTASIAEFSGMSYQNAKKHLDRLVSMSLVMRSAGFGRETSRGIAPVWKYSLAPGALTNIATTLGIFASITAPAGYNDIRDRIRLVRAELARSGGPEGPVLVLIGGPGDGRAFPVSGDRVALGREDPDHPAEGTGTTVVLPDAYRAVTRIAKVHAFLERTGDAWQIEDNGSTGGTFLNGRRLDPLKMTRLSGGDVIDLSLGASAARFLFIADE